MFLTPVISSSFCLLMSSRFSICFFILSLSIQNWSIVCFSPKFSATFSSICPSLYFTIRFASSIYCKRVSSQEFASVLSLVPDSSLFFKSSFSNFIASSLDLFSISALLTPSLSVFSFEASSSSSSSYQVLASKASS